MLNQYKYRDYLKNLFQCLFYGAFCGLTVGVAIFVFKLAAHFAEDISRSVYSAAKSSPLCAAGVFAALILLAAAMYFLHKKIPAVKGGGIPRSEGILRGVLSFKWLRTLVGTFSGSMISYIAGLPLGSEGPAVLIGTSLGGMSGNLTKNKSAWSRYIMTGGAGAGFAVATGAPFSAILFALEEIHKRFTPMLVIMVSVSVISASCANEALCNFFGLDTRLFDIPELHGFELTHIGYLLALGSIIALFVILFDASIALFFKLTKKCEKILTPLTKLIVLFVTVGVLGIFFSEGIYSGHHMIEEVLSGDKTLLFLLAVLFVRMLLMLLVTDSGATGGIFIPTLAIGVLISASVSKLFSAIGLSEELLPTVILLGTCAFIGGTLRSPITATVLFIELTGSYTNLLYVVTVISIVGFITELTNQESFYDRVIDNMKSDENKGKTSQIKVFRLKVSDGSFVIGKTVRDVMWPASSVVLGITRDENNAEDMESLGEKKIYANDTLTLRASFFDEEELKEALYGLVGREYEISESSARSKEQCSTVI